MEPLEGLTREDFQNAGWERIVEECSDRECYAYSSRFGTRARELSGPGEIRSRQIFELLRDITSLHMRLDSSESPFGPMMALHDRRTPIAEDFDETRLSLLSEVINEIFDAELRARIADILWLRKRDFRMAEIAVDAYLESAARLEDPETWPPSADRIERALQLSANLGRNGELFRTVVEYIETILAKYNGEDPLLLSAKLMELLQDKRAADPKLYAPLAEKLAIRAESSRDWERARIHWACKTKWHFMGNENDEARNSIILEAETYIKQSEDVLLNETPSYLLASTFIQRAIEAYRRAGNSKERINDLHIMLLDYQQRSLTELRPSSSSVDITDIVEKAINEIEGKTASEALICLPRLCRSPKVEQLRSQAQKNRKRFLIQTIIPRVYINALGRTIARQPADEEESIQADMYSNASAYRQIHAQAVIEPARRQIYFEHSIRVGDFISFLSNNPFVQAGREVIIARGLYAGMVGDYLSAVHLLIPQLEASLRYILSQLQVISSALDNEGIQDEFNINKILSAAEYSSHLSRTLGEDLVFDLRGLLVERFGANLRNEMAHGLMEHTDFYSGASCYCWWLALRFYMIPILSETVGNKGDNC